MPAITVLFGTLLLGLGIWGYWGGVLGLWEPLGFAAPSELSATALIPAVLGAVLVVLGALAFKESLLKHTMHAAAMFGVLGFLSAGGRLLFVLFRKGKIEGVAGTSSTAMTVLCAVFVALCINSFLQVRRRRALSAQTQPRL